MLLPGDKVSREPYTNEGRQLLRTLSREVAITIENAYRYEIIQRGVW